MITLKNERLKKGMQAPRVTRGQVAAQEQIRLIGQYVDGIFAGYKEVTIPT
jgi:hypothetical protein